MSENVEDVWFSNQRNTQIQNNHPLENLHIECDINFICWLPTNLTFVFGGSAMVLNNGAQRWWSTVVG